MKYREIGKTRLKPPKAKITLKLLSTITFNVSEWAPAKTACGVKRACRSSGRNEAGQVGGSSSPGLYRRKDCLNCLADMLSSYKFTWLPATAVQRRRHGVCIFFQSFGVFGS